MKHPTATIAVFTFGMISFISVLASGNENTTPSLLLGGAFLISLLTHSIIVYRKQLDPVSYLTTMYFVYAFTLPGIYQLRTDTFYWYNNSVRRDLLIDAAFITFTGTLALMAGISTTKLGRLFGTSFGSTGASTARPMPAKRYDRKRASIASFVISAICLAFIILQLAQKGPLVFFGTREMANLLLSGKDGDSGSAFVKTICSAMALTSFTITGIVRYWAGIKNSLTKVSIIASVTSLSIACFPTSLPRFWMIALAMTVGLVLIPNVLRRKKGIFFASGPIALFSLFPFLSSLRRGENLDASFEIKNPFDYLLHGDFDGYQSMINVVVLVQNEGFAFGGRIISTVLFFVPRSIWSGKYDRTGAEAADSAGYLYLNISMPLPGEIYADGGIIITAIVLFAIGRLIGTLDSIYSSPGMTLGSIPLSSISILIAGFVPILARGSLISVIGGPAVAISLVAAWSFLYRLKIRRT
ncbi:hypothetical protein M3484_02030 [Pseudomonas sp. GX19020]|uniref:hypothetical protein n=1 Tax=Pseudomonas sp. GX19020 TaxID=2942277 RepID=UPI0020197311|nr:hypothetical protein [Pseudomonas sp. GX19020]MCL4065355.1 hypothetical protein [Pseudomonas sp. GX19020]